MVPKTIVLFVSVTCVSATLGGVFHRSEGQLSDSLDKPSLLLGTGQGLRAAGGGR